MPDNFFALLSDDSIRRISLLQSIESSVKDVFVTYGTTFLEGREEEEFDGNYKIEDDEVLFVTMTLPNTFLDIAINPISYPILDLQNDRIKALFWFENNTYYFQNFDQRGLSAEERYDYMMETQPEIVLRVPTKYMASHLGINEFTLSKIRGKR
jgi:hypothetical protein